MTDALPQATEAFLLATARRCWIEDRRPERLLLVRARPVWSGAQTLPVGAHGVRVTAAVSPLAVHDLLATADEADRLVVLTDASAEELGAGLLAHAAGQRIHPIDPWEAVRSLFRVSRAEGIDPLLLRDGRAVAEALVEGAPVNGWPAAPMGLLTRDHAYQLLAEQMVGLAPDQLDVAGLLEWTRRPSDVARFEQLSTELCERLGAWLVRRLGIIGDLVVRTASAGHGHDFVPLGVVAGLLWDSVAPDQRAQVRVEPLVGGHTPSAEQARVWSDATRAWVQRRLGRDRAPTLVVLNRAEELLVEVQASGAAVRSDLLPAGLAARITVLAQAIGAALARPQAAQLGSVETALASVMAHRLSDGDPRVTTAGLAVRLLRWVTATDQPTIADVTSAVAWQMAEGGWVDRARNAVWAGGPDEAAHAVYAQLHEVADARRAEVDQRAATLVAQQTLADAARGSLMGVEDVIADVVLPVKEQHPVLLIVVDGMSASVATQLVESAMAAGLVEQVREPHEQRAGALAVLPTITEASRTSLFCGRLLVGGQREERLGVAEMMGPATDLFHQAQVEGGAGARLAPPVEKALLQRGRNVAVVLNDVDDALDSGDPGRTLWSVDTVRHLRDLLELAAAVQRVVILTSDHGHVVDRRDAGELRSGRGAEAARWRPAESDPDADEVLLEGRRVLLGGGRVIAPWSETVRYTARKDGYHGGASLAELVAPVVMLTPPGVSVEGWRAAPPQEPRWWNEPVGGAERSLMTAKAGEAATIFDVEPIAPEQVVDELLTTLDAIVNWTSEPADRELAGHVLHVLVEEGSLSVQTLARVVGRPAADVRRTVSRLASLLQEAGASRELRVTEQGRIEFVHG